VDGDKFTGFIVERGNRRFYTRSGRTQRWASKVLQQSNYISRIAKLPVENLLGEVGKGHKIAFNILNIGRLKLCAAAIGGARRALSNSVEYAKTREQFKQPIANFGAIKHKLAEMAFGYFVGEAAYIAQQNG
jgi:alkylation response protein AidB-like acyl-CoA dehydrogenase